MEKKNDAEGRAKLKAALIDADIEYSKILSKCEDIEVPPIERDVTGTPIYPGHPKLCLGSGNYAPMFECCCDNCPHFLKCFPDAMPHAVK